MAMPNGGLPGAVGHPLLGKLPPPMEPPQPGMQVDIPGAPSPSVDPATGARSTTHPDGGMTIEFGGATDGDGRLPDDIAWDANLAEHLDEQILTSAAEVVLEGIEADIKSMEAWLKDYTDAVAALGTRYEDRQYPFAKASGVSASILLDAVVRGSANASGEMLPAGGPVKVAIYGSDGPGPKPPGATSMEQKAERKKNFYNYLFTSGDRDFRDDFDQMLFQLWISGTMVRKVYRDPKTGMPTSRAMPPQNTIISYHASGINAGRVTHRMVMEHSELIRMQLAGEYRWLSDNSLKMPDNATTPQQKLLDKAMGRKDDRAQEDFEHEIFECHCDLDIDHPSLQHMQASEDEPDKVEPSGMAMPYVLTVDKSSRKVLALRRNWKKGDKLYRRKIRFAVYRLVPGVGFFGFGMGHLVGGNQRAATQMLRQFIDSTTLKMFPGGVTIAKAVRPEQNRMPIGPSEFREIDTGGKPINQAFAALPYNEPPQSAVEAIKFVTDAGKSTGNTSELQVGDGQANAPVGSVVALLNVALKPESAILKRLYHSFANELLIYEEMLGEEPTRTYPYEVKGNPTEIMGRDFDGKPDVIPVGDPNIPTQTGRIMQASAVEALAEKSPPGLFDAREVRRQLLETLGKTDEQIDKLMPPTPQAFSGDLVTEIMFAMQSKPIRSTPMQDHLSHIKGKLAAMQAPGVVQMPAANILMSNIAEHYAFLFHDQVEAALNQQAQAQWQQQAQAAQAQGQPIPPKPQPVQLPPPGQPMPPQVENQISSMVAGAMQGVIQQLQSMAGASGDASAAIEQQIRLKEIEQKEQDSKRKTGGAIIQNRTELVKTTATTADNAAQRDTDVELARINLRIAEIELEKARVIAGSNVARAHVGLAETTAKLGSEQEKTEVARDKVGADHHKADATVEVAEHGTKQAVEGTKQAELAIEQERVKPKPAAPTAKGT